VGIRKDDFRSTTDELRIMKGGIFVGLVYSFIDFIEFLEIAFGKSFNR